MRASRTRSTKLVLAACFLNLAFGKQGAEEPHYALEVDRGSAIIRRSAPLDERPEDIPGVALDEGTQSSESHSFGVASADAKFKASGLMKTLHMLEQDEGAEEEKKLPLGTLVLLVNSSDEAEMHSLENNLVPSLLSSLQFRTPVTVLYSGPQRAVDDATFKLHLNPKISPISLVDVTERIEQFAREHAPQEESGQGKRWKMEEFWAMHVHLLPELQNYHYAWRLSPSSNIKGDVTSDLYQVMREHKAVFGYRLLQNVRTQACTGLEKAVKAFYEANSGHSPESLTARAFLETYETAQCPQWTPDFQLVDLDYLRSNEIYGEYVAYLAEKDGFSKHGWGSHSAQTVFLATQLEPEKIMCMTPWVPKYHGESKTSCGAGLGLINFGENAFKDSFAQMGALQVEEVHHARHPNVLLNVSSKPDDVVAVSSNSTLSTIAVKGHAIFIGVFIGIVALSILGGGLTYNKGWGRSTEAPPADDS